MTAHSVLERADASPVAAPTHRFSIRGQASPQLAIRILGLWAQLGLVPLRFEARQYREALVVTVDHHGFDQRRAEVLLDRIRSMVEVEQAMLQEVAV